MEQDKEPKNIYLFGLEFPIYKEKLIHYTLIIWVLLGLLLTVSVFFFQYEMTRSDIPGGLISGVLLAYLITILAE